MFRSSDLVSMSVFSVFFVVFVFIVCVCVFMCAYLLLFVSLPFGFRPGYLMLLLLSPPPPPPPPPRADIHVDINLVDVRFPVAFELIVCNGLLCAPPRLHRQQSRGFLAIIDACDCLCISVPRRANAHVLRQSPAQTINILQFWGPVVARDLGRIHIAI